MRTLDQLIVKSKAGLRLAWTRRDGWLAEQYGHTLVRPAKAPREDHIERQAARADAETGPVKAWHLYGAATRRPNQVRSAHMIGRFYADLIARRRPETVLEFGAAFGVSGMYFTAALEAAGAGRLHSFEINPEWATVAARNIATVGDRFTLTVGAFEDHVDQVSDVDVAFIDAVHTREWVMPQFDLVAKRCRPGAVVLFDDIDFSAEMRDVWAEVARDDRVVGSVAVADHLGVVELR